MTEPATPVGGVRRAEAADLVELVELRAEMFRAMGTSGVDDHGWRRAALDWFRAALPDPRVCIVVVETGARVVATAMAAVRDSPPSPSCPSGGTILISNVCTAPDARRRGHGRAAFTAVLEWAGSTGVPRIELLATGDGQRMYEAAGFEVTRYPAMRLRPGNLSSRRK